MLGITTEGLSFGDAEIAAIVHDAPFDPTCGYTIAQLCAMTGPGTEPVDFADFWQETYERAILGSSVTAMAPSFEEVAVASDEVRQWAVSFSAYGCVRVHADLREPAAGPVRGLVVHGHGYGGPGGDASWARQGYASLHVHQRGFGRTVVAGLTHNTSVRHVIHQILDRDAYVLRGCVAEIWQAASLLRHRHPDAADRLIYEGGSFGGGIGALAMAWDPRFRCALLHIPTFGHHPVRLSHQCHGSGEAVRRYSQRKPELLDILPYYDAATAAAHIRCPVHVGVAAFDPAVIPPGQFAVANAIQSAGSRAVIIPAAHFEPSMTLWPQAARDALAADRHAFLAQHLGD